MTTYVYMLTKTHTTTLLQNKHIIIKKGFLTATSICIYFLFCYIFACRILMRFRAGLGIGRCLDGFPVRTDQCGSDAVVEVP